MQWRKLGRMKLVAASEPHRRRESLIKVKSPLIANFYIASATHDRFWPFASVAEVRRFGSDWGHSGRITNIVESSRMTRSSHRNLSLA